MKTHSVYIRMMSLLLAVLCIVGLFPASALAASPNTIKLEDCTYNGVHYDSPALGICYMHQMQFDFNGDSVMGFCSEKGKGMGWSLEGHEWNSPKEINDSTVKIMMAYFYCHTKGIFTDRAQALGLDEVWGSDYTWTMNAWVQAVVWRYKALVVYEPEAAIVRMMFENYLSGQSASEIARDLNSRGIKTKTGKSTWRSTKVAYILGNERYCGDCKYQKTYRDTTVPFKQFRNRGQEDMFYASMTHAPLIDRDTFDKVQLLLKKRQDVFGKSTTQNIYPLTSRIQCSECGSYFRRRQVSGISRNCFL